MNPDDQDRADEAIDLALRILCNAADALLIREQAEPSSMRPIRRVVVMLDGVADRVVVAALDRRSVPRRVHGEWLAEGRTDRSDPIVALLAMARGLFAARLHRPDAHKFAAWPIRRATVDVTESGALVDLDVFAAHGDDEGVNLLHAAQERAPAVG
jgi:hypothetical protein